MTYDISSSEYYDLDPRFPRDQYILRSEESAKNRTVYFCSESVKNVLESPDVGRLHIVNTGVRLLVRQGGEESAFRLTAEGLPLLERVITSDRRKVEISYSDLKLLLTEMMPKLDAFEPATRARLADLGIIICC